jgi:hypothetical protein
MSNSNYIVVSFDGFIAEKDGVCSGSHQSSVNNYVICTVNKIT